MIQNMHRHLCCCAFADENKFERYDRTNDKAINGLYAKGFVLQGIGDLPSEIIVEYLFPYLGIYDIKNLGDTGDSRLKYLVEDYLSGSTCINIYKQILSRG